MEGGKENKDGKLEGERKQCRVRVSKVKRNIRITFDDKTRTVLLESSLGSQSNSQLSGSHSEYRLV